MGRGVDSSTAILGLTDVVPFLVEGELQAKGDIYPKGPDWGPYFIQDGLLITGQNPASSAPAAERLVEVLKKSARAPMPCAFAKLPDGRFLKAMTSLFQRLMHRPSSGSTLRTTSSTIPTFPNAATRYGRSSPRRRSKFATGQA